MLNSEFLFHEYSLWNCCKVEIQFTEVCVNLMKHYSHNLRTTFLDQAVKSVL